MRRDTGGSIFRKIAADIRARILAGEFPPGEKLPTEKLLAFHYDVGKWAVGEAISLLRVEGYVEAYVPGRGTVVRDRPEIQDVAFRVDARVTARPASAEDAARDVDDGIEPGVWIFVVTVGGDEYLYRADDTAINFVVPR